MSLYGALAEAVREGKELLAARATLGAGGTLAVNTPFVTIDAVVVSAEGGAPTVVPRFSVSGSTVTFTGDNNATVSYIIIGRRRR